MLWLIDVTPGTWCGVRIKKTRESGPWSRKAQGLYRQVLGWLVTKGPRTVQAGVRLAGKQANLKSHSAYPVRSTIYSLPGTTKRDIDMSPCYERVVTAQATTEPNPIVCTITDCHIATANVQRYHLECLHRDKSELVHRNSAVAEAILSTLVCTQLEDAV